MSKRRSKGRARRHNPTRAVTSQNSATKDYITGSLMLAGGAVVTNFGMKALFAKLPTSVQTQHTVVKAAIKVGVGLGGGYLIAKMVPSMSMLGAGVAIGGSFAGLDDIWNTYVAPQLRLTTGSSTTDTAMPTAADQATAAAAASWNAAHPTAAVRAVFTPPGGRVAYLPAAGARGGVSIPAGYVTHEQAACR